MSTLLIIPVYCGTLVICTTCRVINIMHYVSNFISIMCFLCMKNFVNSPDCQDYNPLIPGNKATP